MSDSERIDALREQFLAVYGAEPDFYCIAPGRVNLIGEHVDYMLLPVVPMAIHLNFIMAGRISTAHSLVKVSHLECDRFEGFEIGYDPLPEPDPSAWHGYVICGLRGLYDMGFQLCNGLELMGHGTVPLGSGLSSSSALTVASLMSFLYGAGEAENVSLATIADNATRCERYIGTLSGGMDQACSCLAKKDHALRISFTETEAPSVEHFPLSPETHILVVNSLVQSCKAESASGYNVRVTECRLGCLLLSELLNLDVPLMFLSPLLPLLSDWEATVSSLPQFMTLEDVSTAVRYDVHDLVDTDWMIRNEIPSTFSFSIRDRIHHVISENERVHAFCDALGALDISLMGKLMNESHASCTELYHCGHPRLDQLVQLLRENGAVGARLTGAGWGGCCIGLFDNSKHSSGDWSQILFKVKQFLEPFANGVNLEEAVFYVTPADGAKFVFNQR